jgi:hypothetical protein
MSNKKVLSKIDLGKYTKPNPFHKDIIYDPKGQWKHPGQNTRIPGKDITMQGVPYPVYAQPNVGQPQMMYPDQNYQFPGADYVDEFPQMKKGGQSDVKFIGSKDGVETPIYKKVNIKPSKIHGNGLFTKEAIKKNEPIGICHVKNKDGELIPSTILGMYNHNKKTPNVYEINKGDHVVMMPLRDISPGEELTADYDMIPIEGLQDSSSFKDAGEKKFSKKKKGGALLTKKVTCKSCGWKWDAEDGGNDITTCHKCGGQGLIHAQDGGPTSPEEWGQQIKDIERQIGNPSGWTLSDYNTLQNKLNEYKSWRENTPEGQAVIDSHNEEGEYDIPLPEHLQDYTNAMMKARLAYANEFGNPAAKRMINLPDNPYQFDNGDTGSHYMASMDNYAVPQIQDENGVLVLGDYGPESNEAIRFDSDEDANYFAENYKDVSPGFLNEKQYGGISNDYIEADLDEDEIEEYKRGGYVVEDISVPSLNQMRDGGTIYTVKGSKGHYKKVNGKWQVDWNRSGKYQPLSKGDVKARTAVLDKMAKPIYTPSPKIDPYAKINSNSSDNTKLNLYQKEIPWELSTKYKGDILAQNKKNKEDAINYRAKNTISNEDFDKDNHISTEFPKNATASDYGQRIWEYATNPGTALEYAFGKKSGQGPMPFNINQLKEQGVNVNSNSNLVGNMFNMINPLDDVESVRSGVSDINEGNNSGYLNAGLGILGFLPGGDALKGLKKYGKDLVQTSKQAGKFQFPKYKTVYRAEHAGYNQAAKEGSVDGRWVASNPKEVSFYVDKLKDPATGHVLPYSFGDQPVRIIQQRLPEYEIKNTFGAGMPEEARIMSMGRGEFTNEGLDDLLGFGTGSRFARQQFNQHDINAMSTAPFLYNKNEGLLDANLINKLRNQEGSNFFSSGKNNVFNNQKDALDYLKLEQKLIDNNNMFKKYLPFKEGGINNNYVELDLTPDEITEYKRGGYIVEELNDYAGGGSPIWPPGRGKNKTYLTYSPFYGNSLTGQSSNMGYADNPFSDEKSDFFKVNTIRMPQSYIGVSGGADPYGKFNHNQGIMQKLGYDAYVGLPYNYDPNNTNYYSNTPSVGGRIRYNNTIDNQWLGIPWNKVFVEASGDYSQSDGLNANFSFGTRFDGKKGNSKGYFEPHIGASGSWGPHGIKPGAYSANALAEYQAIMGSNDIPDLEGDSVNMSDPMIQMLLSDIYNENIENPLAKGKKQQGAMADIDLGFKTGFEWSPKFLTKRLPGSKIFGDLRYTAQPIRGMFVSGMSEDSQNSVGNYNGVQTSLSDQSETNKLSFSHQFTGGLGLKVPIGTVKDKIQSIDLIKTRIPKDCMCPDGTKVDLLEDGTCPCDDHQIEECPPCPDGSVPRRLKDGTCPCKEIESYPEPDEYARHPRWLRDGGTNNNYVDVELTPKEIKDLIAQGYVIEELN